MKNRYRLIRYRHRGGNYYLHDNQTGQRESLEIKDKSRALEILTAKNESAREPAFNLQKARVYMAASDPGVATRNWGHALKALIASKRKGSANQDRWETFAKDRAIQPLLNLVILETRTDQILSAVTGGTVSTNV